MQEKFCHKVRFPSPHKSNLWVSPRKATVCPSNPLFTHSFKHFRPWHFCQGTFNPNRMQPFSRHVRCFQGISTQTRKECGTESAVDKRVSFRSLANNPRGPPGQAHTRLVGADATHIPRTNLLRSICQRPIGQATTAFLLFTSARQFSLRHLLRLSQGSPPSIASVAIPRTHHVEPAKVRFRSVGIPGVTMFLPVRRDEGRFGWWS
jgi:hypothetical protein